MADRAQLQRQVGEKLLGGQLLMGERRGVANQRLGEMNGRRHLHTGLRARPYDRDAAAEDEPGDIDQHEYRQELCAQ